MVDKGKVAGMGRSASPRESLDSGQTAKVRFLASHGWKRDSTQWPWQWFKPPLRGTYYRLNDAYDLERSRQK